MQKPSLVTSLALLSLLCTASALSIAATQSPQEAPELWTVVQEGFDGSRPQAARDRVLWDRVVRVGGELLRQRTSPGARLRLGLRPGVEVDVELTRITDSELNGYVWNGHVVDEPLSMVTLVLEPGGVAGTVVYSGGSYHVRLIGDGLSAVRQQARRRRGDIVRIPQRSQRRAGKRRSIPSARRVASWDFLALFTKQAAKENGGRRATLADWKVAIANWNTALDNSGVDAVVRLIKTRKWNNARRGSDDEKVATWRKKFGADFAGAAIEFNEAVCGVGWLNGADAGVRPIDRDYALHVNSVDCLAGFGGLTAAHEGGHNGGVNHDEFNARSTEFGAYSYAFGYRVPGEFSTVMAYTCEPDGLARCPQIPYFSTPLLAQSGTPIGVKNQAHNARSLTNDRAIIEQWFDCRKNC